MRAFFGGVRGAFAVAAVFASAMFDPWREAMLDGAFDRAWVICDDVLRQRAGGPCADLPHHLRWVWDGTPLANRRVLLRCYHGLGDTLQFIRFVPNIAAIARGVVVEAQQCLIPLLRSVCDGVRFYPLDGELPKCDVAVESMEVPHALRLSLADLPGLVPYLRASSSPSPPPRRARIGLVWAGGDWRRERSIPPCLLLPLTELPADFIGLQLGPARHEAAAAPLLRRLTNIIPEDTAITDTAALIAGLDLVITIDTMAAHLAGALGRPVWTLLDAAADWRWMRHRGDSPWYPTMRLFRQPCPGAWEPAVAQVTAALGVSNGRAQLTAHKHGDHSSREHKK